MYDSNTNKYKYAIIGLNNILAHYRQRVNLHRTFELKKTSQLSVLQTNVFNIIKIK